MKLILINFEMDPESQVLGWQARVATGLAELCQNVIVITHKAVLMSLPENMEVHLFPRPLLRAPLRWLGGKWLINVYVLFLHRRFRFDACFIHMNMTWAIYLAPVFRMLGVPVLLWYAHGTVTTRLKLAHRLVTRVVTSSPEGFRLPSNKVRIIGQGVDAQTFRPQVQASEAHDVITVGRISRRKNYHRMIDAMERLWSLEPDVPFRLVIVGAPLTREDRRYQEELEERRMRCLHPDRVIYTGKLLPGRIVECYRSVFVHLNLSGTGSMDKTVLEALSAGCPVVTSNEAFAEILKGSSAEFLPDHETGRVASALQRVHRERATLDRESLRALVIGKHDLATFGGRILRELEDIVAATRLGALDED